jgi:hypothetical protein
MSPGNKVQKRGKKIKFKNVTKIRRPKSDCQHTTFHQQLTTTSPQKHHVKTPVFSKTPSKNALPPQNKKTAPKPKKSGPATAEPPCP